MRNEDKIEELVAAVRVLAIKCYIDEDAAKLVARCHLCLQEGHSVESIIHADRCLAIEPGRVQQSNGLYCYVCLEPQICTPAGATTCRGRRGHGDARGLTAQEAHKERKKRTQHLYWAPGRGVEDDD